MDILNYNYYAVKGGTAAISAAEGAAQSTSASSVEYTSKNSNMQAQVCPICIHIADIDSSGAIYCTICHTPLLIRIRICKTSVATALDSASATTATMTTVDRIVLSSLSLLPYSINYKLICMYPGNFSGTAFFRINSHKCNKFAECFNQPVQTLVNNY